MYDVPSYCSTGLPDELSPAGRAIHGEDFPPGGIAFLAEVAERYFCDPAEQLDAITADHQRAMDIDSAADDLADWLSTVDGPVTRIEQARLESQTPRPLPRSIVNAFGRPLVDVAADMHAMVAATRAL